MSNIFFISDLHFGHNSILQMSPIRQGATIEEHDDWIISQFNSVVTKNDTVYILGDVAFPVSGLQKAKLLNGNKLLVRGNHDRHQLKDYLNVFSDVYGILKRYGFWISHAPVHPAELRGYPNIHGHVHNKHIMVHDDHSRLPIRDKRYYNVCVEALNAVPKSLDDIKNEVFNG